MASAPSNTAIDTSETSARVGTGEVIIDSSIWVATTTGLPKRRAMRIIRFCRPGTCLDRHFDAEIAAGDHEGVAELDDLLEPLDGLRLFDLGHDAGAALDDLADIDDVLGALHEAQRDPVGLVLERLRAGRRGPSRSARRSAAAYRAG